MSRSYEISDVDFISRRLRMVDEQLMKRGVTDAAVLAAMRTVPRHEFVSVEDHAEAYADHPLPIECNQTISQPYIVGSMTQQLDLIKSSRVLEIGTGCGYQCAVLAEIVEHVYSIEYIPDLLKDSNERLAKLGYKNITTMLGDGSLGWPQEAPFDAIIVTAATPKIPQALSDQLAIGGRMVIPIEVDPSKQELMLVKKTADGITRRTLYGVRFVQMQGAARK